MGWGDREGGNREGEGEGKGEKSWQGPGVGRRGGWTRRSGVGRGRQEGGNGEETGRGRCRGAT